MQMTPPYGRKWRTKGPLDESERGEWKNLSKLSIQETKVKASGSITSWQIEGEKVETVTDFLSLGSKITVDGDCSHEIKTLTSWKEGYDKPRQHIKKQRHHIADKVIVKAMVFLVVMYKCKSWTMKKVKHWRIDAFKF